MPDQAPSLFSRRDFFTGAAVLATLPLLPSAAAAAGAGSAAPGTIHIVDGWVLTSEDLKALGLHAR